MVGGELELKPLPSVTMLIEGELQHQETALSKNSGLSIE